MNKKGTVSQKRAREIMGENFLGIEEVSQHFGVSFGKKLVKFDEIPFPKTVLTECKDTHILFPGFPLTILDVRSKVSPDLFQRMHSWYIKKVFAKKDKVELRWYLIRKDTAPESTSKKYQQQLAILSKNEEVPRACEVFYMIILYFLTTGIFLFEDNLVRCRDETDGNRVRLGFFHEQGLRIEAWGGADAYPAIGVSASRKIPS